MRCTHCQATDRKFGRRLAEGDRRRYRRHGPDATTGAIVRALDALGLEAATLLDVGGGIGVIAHELLGHRVATAVLAEAATAFLHAARREAEARGTVDRIRFVQGDFTAVADDVPAVDVVTLDRVVCCYPDYRGLLTSSLARCRRAYAISYPRDRWSVRVVFALQNLARRLVGDPFRTFVHPPAAIEQTLTESGLVLASRVRTAVWVIDLYLRK